MTSWISLAVMAVLVVLYMMRRKARLSRED
jgi:cytochrome oxidase assembly protein ShyY1